MLGTNFVYKLMQHKINGKSENYNVNENEGCCSKRVILHDCFIVI